MLLRGIQVRFSKVVFIIFFKLGRIYFPFSQRTEGLQFGIRDKYFNNLMVYTYTMRCCDFNPTPPQINKITTTWFSWWNSCSFSKAFKILLFGYPKLFQKITSNRSPTNGMFVSHIATKWARTLLKARISPDRLVFLGSTGHTSSDN